MNAVDCIQGSPEWLITRCGMVTSSRVADAICKLKRSPDEAACRRNLRMAIACERLTGRSAENYVSADMEWGIETEPVARAAYELANDLEVDTVGFVFHPTLAWGGASPDGLVGADGLIETKCPKTTTHIEYLLAGVVPTEYQPQMLWQMACAERQWCDFVSFDPRLPKHLQLFIARFPRDEARIAAMQRDVNAFLAEVDELIAKLPTKAGETALEHQLEVTERDIAEAVKV